MNKYRKKGIDYKEYAKQHCQENRMRAAPQYELKWLDTGEEEIKQVARLFKDGKEVKPESMSFEEFLRALAETYEINVDDDCLNYLDSKGRVVYRRLRYSLGKSFSNHANIKKGSAIRKQAKCKGM
jgi:hypothetical protein